MSPWLSDLFLSSQSDERLLSLVREGHERAFTVIVERYRRELHAFAARWRSDGRAEDLVQQTFLSAFAALRSGAEVTHLRGWLYQILRNASIAAAGRPDAEAELEVAALATEPLEDSVERKILTRDVLSEIATLPDRQRDALIATAIHGRSRAAVASSMGLSEGAVRQLMHRARVALRTSVTAITPWPLTKWLAAARAGTAGNRASEIAAGTASAGGVALKLGAVVASGVVATGIAASQLHPHHAARQTSAGVRPAHAAATPGARGISRRGLTASAVLGVPLVAGAGVGGGAERTGPRSVGEHSGGGEDHRSGVARPGRAPGGPGVSGRDGGGGLASGTDGGRSGGSSGDGAGGGPDGPLPSTGGSGSRDGGGGPTAVASSDGGTRTMTSTTSTSGSHDGGGGPGSSDDGSGGGGSTTTPVVSPSGDSGSSGGSGSGGGPGSNGTSGSSGTPSPARS